MFTVKRRRREPNRDCTRVGEVRQKDKTRNFVGWWQSWRRCSPVGVFAAAGAAVRLESFELYSLVL